MSYMDTAQPQYHTPSTIERACGLLAEADRPAIVAGGQSLTLSIEDESKRPDTLVDINEIDELGAIEQFESTLSLGAVVTHAQIESSTIVTAAVPSLSTAAAEIADQQIRNAGTIGGTTAFRYHTADYPPVLVASDATIHSQTSDDTREISAIDYFLEPAANSLADDELITTIHVPISDSNQGLAYEAFSYPGHTRGLVNTAASLTIVDGKCIDATLVVGCVDDHPQTVPSATDLLIDSPMSSERLSQVAQCAADAVSITTKREVSATYLRSIVAEMSERVLQSTKERAEDNNE